MSDSLELKNSLVKETFTDCDILKSFFHFVGLLPQEHRNTLEYLACHFSQSLVCYIFFSDSFCQVVYHFYQLVKVLQPSIYFSFLENSVPLLPIVVALTRVFTHKVFYSVKACYLHTHICFLCLSSLSTCSLLSSSAGVGMLEMSMSGDIFVVTSCPRHVTSMSPLH